MHERGRRRALPVNDVTYLKGAPRTADRVLVVMAKAPRPGKVKTRLTASLSPVSAASFYTCLLRDTLALGRSLANTELAIMCPEADAVLLAELAGPDVQVATQQGDGLAAGLTSVFRHFTSENARRIIAFNSDSPHLPRRILEQAFEILASKDLVVGPTDDGGYYLVGSKQACPSLFAWEGMGTSSAFERLLANANALKLAIGMAETFYDVDLYADLTRLARELSQHPERAPETAHWLQEWQSQAS